MTDATRSKIWSPLEGAFADVYQTLHSLVPGVKMQCGHHWNEAFAFWAYAEFSAGGRTVVISFSVQANGDHFDIWGDVAKEDGYVLREVMRATINGTSDGDDQFIDKSGEFARRCKRETSALIVKELM